MSLRGGVKRRRSNLQLNHEIASPSVSIRFATRPSARNDILDAKLKRPHSLYICNYLKQPARERVFFYLFIAHTMPRGCDE